MTVKRLIVMLLVPLGLIALVPVFAPGMFSGANEDAGDRLAGLLGNIYGVYFGLLVVYFIVQRRKARSS